MIDTLSGLMGLAVLVLGLAHVARSRHVWNVSLEARLVIDVLCGWIVGSGLRGAYDLGLLGDGPIETYTVAVRALAIIVFAALLSLRR